MTRVSSASARQYARSYQKGKGIAKAQMQKHKNAVKGNKAAEKMIRHYLKHVQ